MPTNNGNNGNGIPQVNDVAQNVAALAGGQIIGAIESTLPYVLPVLAVLYAIRFTLGKIGLGA